MKAKREEKCHCERSETIQRISEHWSNGLPRRPERTPRNDVEKVSSSGLSRRSLSKEDSRIKCGNDSVRRLPRPMSIGQALGTPPKAFQA